MRLRPDVVIRLTVVNRSARSVAKPRIIVLHSTESGQLPGKNDLASVVAWFNNPLAQASAHVITDADGTSARCVPDDEKAWACAGFNSLSLNVEQIGFASQGRWADAELRETARWIARWSRKYGIPIQRGAVAGANVTRAGVLLHSELGAVGGGHHDPGPNYPVARVLRMASEIKTQLAKEHP